MPTAEEGNSLAGPSPMLTIGCEPVFPLHPAKLADPGPEIPPERRHWNRQEIYRKMRGWLFPYIRSRALPGDFHPITAYLFLEYKCNVDCWYCWAFNNKVKGMTEDVARRSIDWLHDHGCRVLALMGGEPLLRPQFAHLGWFDELIVNEFLSVEEQAARQARALQNMVRFAVEQVPYYRDLFQRLGLAPEVELSLSCTASVTN